MTLIEQLLVQTRQYLKKPSLDGSPERQRMRRDLEALLDLIDARGKMPDEVLRAWGEAVDQK
jgi:hypothetical protein